MTFEFRPLLKETVYDNHGCPATEDYSMDFAVDGIAFTARTSYFSGYMDIDHRNGEAFAQNVPLLHWQQHSAAELKEAIRTAFNDNPNIVREFHKLKGTFKDCVAKEIATDLLSNPEYAW